MNRKQMLAKLADLAGLRNQRADDIVNTITSMGTTRDPSQYSYFKRCRLELEELEETFAAGGLPRRICELPAQEMTRTWWDFNVSHDSREAAEAVQDYVRGREEELDVAAKFCEAETWARAYGGAIIVIGWDDRAPNLLTPLRKRSGTKIRWLRVYEAVNVQIERMEDNPLSPRYGQPRTYRLLTRADGTPSNTLVHASRCLHFRGVLTPQRMREENHWWDISNVEAVYGALRDLEGTYQGVGRLTHEFGLPTYKMDGQLEMVAGGNSNLVIQAMSLLNLGKSLANAIVIDKEDDFTQNSPNVAGLADLMDREVERVSMYTGIPVTKLAGRAPAGLNSTGEGDQNNWYDEIMAEARLRHGDPLERLRKLILCEAACPVPIEELEDWEQQPVPLYEQSEADKAEIGQKRAAEAKVYVELGAMTPDEVRSTIRKEGFWQVSDEDLGNDAPAGAATDPLSAALESLLVPQEPQPLGAQPAFDAAQRCDDPFSNMGILAAFTRDDFEHQLIDAYEAEAIALADAEIARMGLGNPFNVQNPTFRQALGEFTLSHLPDINATTRRALSVIFADTASAGLGREAMVKRMREVYDAFSQRRATTIVRTEMTRLQSAANQAVWEEAPGVVGKQWNAAFRNTRDSHAFMHGQRADVRGLFMSGAGFTAQHPGGFGVASEDVNCQCVVVPVTVISQLDDADGDVAQERFDGEAEARARSLDRSLGYLGPLTYRLLMEQFDKAVVSTGS